MWKFLVRNQSIEIVEREVLADHQISFDRLDEGDLDLLLGEVRRSAFLSAVFVVAAVDDLTVLVGRVPDLCAIPAAALTAFHLAGEYAHPAIAPAGAALLQLHLHHIENDWLDDGFMVILDIVLRNFAFILLLLFGKEIDREALLQERIALVLFICEDAPDGRLIPDGLDSPSGQLVRNGMGRHALK